MAADHLGALVDYLYTGVIELTNENIEDILMAADFLCMDDLKTRCGQHLLSNLTMSNCVQTKIIADRFVMHNVLSATVDFMSPIFDEIVQQEELLQVPFQEVINLLQNEQLNYVAEFLLFDLAASWLESHPQDRSHDAKKLSACMEPSFIDKDRLAVFLDRNEDLRIALMASDTKRKAIENKLSVICSPSPCEDVLICRSRQITREDPVKLLMYSPQQDTWYELDFNRSWDGLESITVHRGVLYALDCTAGDLCGYMHQVPVNRELIKVYSGGLVVFPGPQSLRGQTRLVSILSDLFAVDSYGMVTRFDDSSDSWFTIVDRLSPFPAQFYLPMPFGHTLFLFRASCFNFSDDNDLELTIHEIDPATKSVTLVSETTAADLGLDQSERFHGYTMTTSCVLICNEMGHPRVKFDMVTRAWSILPRRVPYLHCITDIWGSASCGERNYLVARIRGSNQTSLLAYDYPTTRFKAMSKSLYPLSGVICQMRLCVKEFKENKRLLSA